MKHDIDLLSRVRSHDPIVFTDRNTGRGLSVKLAVWGRLELAEVDAKAYEALRESRSPKKGILVDHINNFKKSANNGVPVYSMPVDQRLPSPRNLLRATLKRSCC